MNYPYYDLHSWSKHYREDVLQITQGHHLAIRTGVGYGKRRRPRQLKGEGPVYGGNELQFLVSSVARSHAPVMVEHALAQAAMGEGAARACSRM